MAGEVLDGLGGLERVSCARAVLGDVGDFRGGVPDRRAECWSWVGGGDISAVAWSRAVEETRVDFHRPAGLHCTGAHGSGSRGWWMSAMSIGEGELIWVLAIAMPMDLVVIVSRVRVGMGFAMR